MPVMINELVRKSRTCRRFYENEMIDENTLVALVDLARLSPSASNLQPLKFLISHTAEKNATIFPLLGWAGYLSDWDGPGPGERPAAYITILGDKSIKKSFGCDHGIAAQSIMLGACEQGLQGCIIASVDRQNFHRNLNLPEQYEILLVLALGKPKEQVVIEPLEAGANIRYWRDAAQVHHVPKRNLEDIIISF